MKNGDIDAAREDPAAFGRLKGRDRDEAVPTLAGRWRNYYENIAQVLAGTAQPEVTLEQARRVMSVLDAGMRSAKSGEVVRVGGREEAV